MLTNIYRIDEPIAKAIMGEEREPKPSNRYSVTKLLGSVREGVLAERYDPIEDVSDRFAAFLGTCIHRYLEENVAGTNELHLEADFDGNEVSGIIDNYDNGVITDYKTKRCSDSDYESAKKQIRLYAWLLRKNGEIARKGRVVAIRRDWSKLRNKGQSPVETIEFPIDSSDIEWAEGYIAERIAEFEKARIELPECSDEEKWKSPDSWAVYAHEGDARAKKVFDSEDEAKEFAKEGMFVEHRIGKNVKCESFCPYSRICRRLTNIKGKGGIE